MNCALCNGNILKKNDILLFKSKTLGEVHIPNIDFEECESCGDILLSPESSKNVLSYIQQKEQDVINQMPIENFITATEAIDILGITKQAFSKNPRIKRGLIYAVTKGKSKLFLKKSVEFFKEKNNGKFLLPQKDLYDQTESTKTTPRYIFIQSIPDNLMDHPTHNIFDHIIYTDYKETKHPMTH